MWVLLVVLAVSVFVSLAAWRFGADSRDGRDWKPDPTSLVGGRGPRP